MRQLLTADVLFDGHERIEGGALLIEGDSIVAAGTRQSIGEPVDAEQVDYGDATLLPGLIDCHDHPAHPGINFARNAYVPVSRYVLEVAASLRVTLENGFTTVRDCAGADVGLKQSVDQGLIPGPRLIVSLTIITQTAGLGDPCIAASGLHSDVPHLPGIPDGVADGVGPVRAKAREIIRAGADFLKIATTGSIGLDRGTYHHRQFSLEEVQAIVEEGRGYGLPTAAHAYCGTGLKNALAAGVHSIEHLGPVDDEDLAFMAENDVFLVPTLCVAGYALDAMTPATENSTRVKNARWFVDMQRERLERARELGVQICLGTDIGAFVHGENARELEYMVNAGLSPIEALKTGTSTAAACLLLEKEIGSLRPGYKADVVAVAGDATQDILQLRKTENILAVFRNGTQYVDKHADKRGAAQ